jgi:hypothetical protein
MAKIKRRRCSKCRGVGHNSATCKKRAKKKTTKKRAAKKKTAKKRTKKKTAKRTSRTSKVEYRVVAYYPTKKLGWGALDGKIRKAAGRREAGAGTALSTGIRDLDFTFKVKAAAERAVKRLRKVKGVRKVRLHTIKD